MRILMIALLLALAGCASVPYQPGGYCSVHNCDQGSRKGPTYGVNYGRDVQPIPWTVP